MIGYCPRRNGRPRLGFAGWLLLAALCACPAAALGQATLFDPRFDDVRKASVVWDHRLGPDRQVVDVVCLVPDVPTFFEAIASWDDRHYFPILIDDVEYTLKFLRAFRPARIVRYPTRGEPIAAEAMWDRALAAVGKSWANESVPDREIPRGDAPPKALGPLPPGVVLSSPEAGNLAGAVALAAGRFQALLQYRTAGKTFVSVPNWDDVRKMAGEIESVVAQHVGKYDALGDDCDFVTLAGDYPYRFSNEGGLHALDDLILRSPRDMKRWAYAGRLTGDATQSVYRAMCSLFLHPRSALLLNAYNQKGSPWSEYSMIDAGARMSRLLNVSQHSGAKAGVAGWHQIFDPINRTGLLMLNSHGSPTVFNLFDGPAQTADVPESEPTAVVMIHSFSAAAPDDPNTIAGRWLANGAYLYFGAMEEPYLQSFRTPGLVATFLAENLPLVTAVRQSTQELFGKPWRLIFLGDPLYRIRPVGAAGERLVNWPAVESWRAYGEFRAPEPGALAEVRLNWALKMAIFQYQRSIKPQNKPDLAATLLGIDRGDLEPRLRPIYDDLLVDVLIHANRTSDLLERLTRIPPDDRTPGLRRHLETLQMAALQRVSAGQDFRGAMSLWSEVIRSPGSGEFVKTFTDRVARLAEGPVRETDWRNRLRAAVRGNGIERANVPVVEAELKRVEEKLDPRKKP